MNHSYVLKTPEDTAKELAKKIRDLRLGKNWKQSTLAERSGVSLASLRRFERTGQASVQNMLKLCFALGRLDEFDLLLEPARASTIDELVPTRTSQRGST